MVGNFGIHPFTYAKTMVDAPSTDADLKIDREKHGRCANCGLQTHEVKQGLFFVGPVLVPLTNDRVISGRCLLCNRLEGDPSSSAETHTAVPITDLDHPIPDNSGCSAFKTSVVLGILFTVLALVGVGIGLYFYFSRQDETPTITSLPTAIEPKPSSAFTTTSTTTMSDITAIIKEPDPTTSSPDVTPTVAIDTTTASTETVATIKEPDLTTASPDIVPTVATATTTSSTETVATTPSVTAQTSIFPITTKVSSTSIKPTTPVSVTTDKMTTDAANVPDADSIVFDTPSINWSFSSGDTCYYQAYKLNQCIGPDYQGEEWASCFECILEGQSDASNPTCAEMDLEIITACTGYPTCYPCESQATTFFTCVVNGGCEGEVETADFQGLITTISQDADSVKFEAPLFTWDFMPGDTCYYQAYKLNQCIGPDYEGEEWASCFECILEGQSDASNPACVEMNLETITACTGYPTCYPCESRATTFFTCVVNGGCEGEVETADFQGLIPTLFGGTKV